MPRTSLTVFDEYLAELTQALRHEPEIVGLVAFGSTAARERVDEWSDHDLAVITRDGAADRFRTDLTWMPHADRITLSVVADHGGVTVVYDDGRLVEFGAASVDEFATWAGDRAEVLFGGAEVHAATAAVLDRGEGAGRRDAARDVRLALAKILVGVGRARRGETLSAIGLITGEAVDHLLRALTERLPGDPGPVGTLDPRRRFERVHPEVAARIAAA